MIGRGGKGMIGEEDETEGAGIVLIHRDGRKCIHTSVKLILTHGTSIE